QGLRNHGNTCFMNAVVQCLSNTAPLAEFLALGRYRARGDRAEVTHRLAALVRALWSLEYTPRLSAEFQSIVAKHGAQFRGNAQHDALEFLLWLLDRMHEDLGSASPAPGPRAAHRVGVPQGGDGAPSCLPAELGRPWQPRESSEPPLPSRLSSLTCPHCRKQSNTFDPFLCISLPIPVRQTRALNVTLVLQREGGRSLRVGLAVPLLGTAAELREMVAREGDVPPEQVVLAEVSPQGVLRSLDDTEELSTAGQGAPLYALQAPPEPPTGTGRHVGLMAVVASAGSPVLPPLHLSPHHASPCPCRVPMSPHVPRFGPPLLLQAERGTSWAQLQRDVLAPLLAVMRSAVQVGGTVPQFRIHVVGEPGTYLSPQDARPLCHAAIDRALRQSPTGGPPHVALTAEWDMGTKERLFGSTQQEAVQDADSVRLQQAAHQQHSCTLDECFQLYTKEEQVGAPKKA
ncbi:UBP43 hydrolase, partial [Odontophorus gujanensis]|nr:UBP43 hydrolase [Odontophorus gujanensis]